VKISETDRILNLTKDMILFHSPEGEAFANMTIDNHLETWSINSKIMEFILTERYMLSYNGKVPSKRSLQQAIHALETIARIRGKKQRVYNRIAKSDNAIYIDLANDNWEAIEINENGWKVIKNPPVYFVRSDISKPLPIPSKNGDITLLKHFINVQNDEDFKLLIAWLLSTVKLGNPFPILILQGEQGSAKSTTAKLIRSIIDPSQIPLRTLPNDEMTLAISAKYTWILAYDNLSGLSHSMSDSFCRMSTGGAITTRTLYTTDEETFLKLQRPLILNGIDDIAEKADLLERSLVINLPRINPERRIDECTFWSDFTDKHSLILGGLCDIISGALKSLKSTKLNSKPRMADFALWITSAEKSLKWEEGTFVKIYENNIKQAINRNLESNPLAYLVEQFMKNRENWIGTVSETLEQLNLLAIEFGINQFLLPSSNKLKNELKRSNPILREFNVEFIDLKRNTRGSMLQIRKSTNESDDFIKSNQGI